MTHVSQNATPSSYDAVAQAAATLPTPAERALAKDAALEKRYWDIFFLGGPRQWRRGKRAWRDGEKLQGAFQVAGAVALVATEFVCVPLMMGGFAAAAASPLNGPRTLEGVWAERLARTVNAHANAADWGNAPQSIAQERQRWHDIALATATKPRRARQDSSLRDALALWAIRIRDRAGEIAAADASLLGAEAGVMNAQSQCRDRGVLP